MATDGNKEKRETLRTLLYEKVCGSAVVAAAACAAKAF